MLSKTKTGAALFLLLALGYGWVGLNIPLDFWSQEEVFNARSLPIALAVAGVILSAAVLLVPAEDQGWEMLAHLKWRPAAALLALMVVYGATLEWLGFPLATLLFLLTGFLIMGERSPVRLIAGSVPLVLLFWLLMGQLGIYLDEGALVRALQGL